MYGKAIIPLPKMVVTIVTLADEYYLSNFYGGPYFSLLILIK